MFLGDNKSKGAAASSSATASDAHSCTTTDDASCSSSLSPESSHLPQSSYAQILRVGMAKIPSGSTVLPDSSLIIVGLANDYFEYIAASSVSSSKVAFIRSLEETVQSAFNSGIVLSKTEYLKLLVLTAESYASLAETHRQSKKTSSETRALTQATNCMQIMTEYLKNLAGEEKQYTYNELVAFVREYPFDFITCKSHDFTFKGSVYDMVRKIKDEKPSFSEPVLGTISRAKIAVSTSERADPSSETGHPESTTAITNSLS
jgi:predicted CopG family antitoxin